MAGRGAPQKKGQSKPFQVTVPQKLYDYLSYLAEHSILGSSEGEVASYIIRKDLEMRLETSFHADKLPSTD